MISPVSSNGCSFVDYDIRSTAELLAQVPSKQIARQITVRDADLFKSIVAEHLESCSWQGPDKYVKSPSVASMIQHFNEVYYDLILVIVIPF